MIFLGFDSSRLINGRIMKTKEILNSVFFILLAFLILYFSKDMKPEFYTIGPDFFPKMLAVFLIFANVPRLVNVLRLKSENGQRSKGNDFAIFFSMLIMALYLFCTFLIGTLLSSIIIIYFLMHYLGNRSHLQKIIFSFGVPLVVKGIFKWVLVLPLPRGILDLI